MRATLLASAISIGSVSVSMAFPVALQPAAAEAVRIHGCHHTYGRDVTGWHRHDRQDHAGVLVAVRDTGPGIDPSHLERVFEAFYTTKSSGMGMGLSVCRSIIDAHGSRLWANANEPRGAVFQFTLPSAESELTKPLQAGHRT